LFCLQELAKFGEFLNNYMKELTKLPNNIKMNEYDPMLLEIEAEWHKFVGEQFAKVIRLSSLNMDFENKL